MRKEKQRHDRNVREEEEEEEEEEEDEDEDEEEEDVEEEEEGLASRQVAGPTGSILTMLTCSPEGSRSERRIRASLWPGGMLIVS